MTTLKEYFVIGLVAIAGATAVTGTLMYQDYKFERNAEIKLQKSLEDTRSKVINFLEKQHIDINDSNGLAKIVKI